MNTGRVPVLVVSGYLGSGKTTLVRHLLAEAQREGVRVAVVANEFGELGIDAALLANPDDAFIELEGGCVCCRLSDELVVTLQQLREAVAPDRIIVETSGVALPFDVQMNLWREPVADWVDDDVAVVVVDAENLHRGEGLDATFEHQVSSADLLLLNKIDLVSPDALPRLDDALREFEPDAPILHATHGAVDPVLLFPPDPNGLREKRRREVGETPSHSHEAFASEVIDVPAGSDPKVLEARFKSLGALRIKGFVETSEGVRLVQGVGARVEVKPPPAPPPASMVGRLVVIRRANGG